MNVNGSGRKQRCLEGWYLKGRVALSWKLFGCIVLKRRVGAGIRD